MTQQQSHSKPSEDTGKIDTVTKKWELCDNRYMRWQPAAVWIIGSIAIIVSLAFAGGRWGSSMESQIKDLSLRCTNIESMSSKLDTIDKNVQILIDKGL